MSTGSPLAEFESPHPIIQTGMDSPKELPDFHHTTDRPAARVARLRDTLDGLAKARRGLKLALETCVNCGVCTLSCPVYLDTGDPGEMPMARLDLTRQVHQLITNPWTRLTLKTGWNWNRHLALFREWFYYVHRCLLCRRCAVHCPLGLDVAEVALASREALAAAGLVDGCGKRTAEDVLRIGNAWGAPARVWSEAAALVEEDIYRETGMAVRVPVDEVDCDVLLIMPAADMFRHQATVAGYAKTFHLAGLTWTTSSHIDVGNCGLVLKAEWMNQLAIRTVATINRLRPKRLVWGESGWGWLVSCQALSKFEKQGQADLGKLLADSRHICEFTLALLEQDRFDGKLDPAANAGLVVTYHDPCHLARSVNLTLAPRLLLTACVPDFREMPGTSIGRLTWCCGAGGGRALDQAGGLDGGGPRAKAFLSSGANFLATSCSTCKSALQQVIEARLNKDLAAGGVMELFGRALTPYLASLTK